MMKQVITNDIRKCLACSSYFIPIDDLDFCETCGPWERKDDASKQEEWHEKLVEND